MYILIVTTTTDAELAKAVHFLCNPRMKITPGEDYTFFRHYTLWAHISYTAQWATHCTVYNVYTSMPKIYPSIAAHGGAKKAHVQSYIYGGGAHMSNSPNIGTQLLCKWSATMQRWSKLPLTSLFSVCRTLEKQLSRTCCSSKSRFKFHAWSRPGPK